MKSHRAILLKTGAQCRAQFCEIGEFLNGGILLYWHIQKAAAYPGGEVRGPRTTEPTEQSRPG